ncbi:hypothetical protein GRX03_11185 [Halovenus sp. WSH3]|uniref:Uncharacterized protein n=1 Tax=Halovenus carboxidivorans TaxID=2692199 RepID=A0A6B0TA95_9EURY|nr:hypothetical protein [Halovenus carboxidivorans]MXR52161.1 hypothetical protein [Halovenus carboxidivorans]
MSSESRPNVDHDPHADCTACGAALAEQRLALQTYPEAGENSIAGLSAGGLLYCPDCASEPVELLAAWDDHAHPPIDADRSIGGGYREIRDRCSFCAEELGSAPVVGVELYRRPSDTLPAYANYTLCSDCKEVFEEFLANVRGR